MRLPFLDRHEEAARLRRFADETSSSLAVVYGRRRLGKSRLIQETLPEDRTVYYMADDRADVVFWEGRLVAHAPCLDVDSTLQDPGQFAFLGRTIDSPFFTADVARLAAGGYTVIEINDGGSSVFPEQMDPRDLYRAVIS